MSVKELKDEICRAYAVLGAERAYGQNWIDIHAWKEQGFITSEEKNVAYYL